MSPRTLPLVLATLALAPSAAAQTPIVLDAEIAAGAPRYFAVPFTVPEGVREIEVRHDDRSEMNILDWGLADPARVRGWGGGNTEAAVVGVDAASRSYLAGAIPAGRWSVLIGQAKVIERPARYHLEIYLRATPTLPAQPERRTYAPAAALATGPRWYAGDFHVHSRESGDAAPTLDEVAAFARSRGLDFVELSEHNTVSSVDFIADAQTRHPALLFVPGIEVTSYNGHANAIGATRQVDFRVGGEDPSVSAESIAAAVAAQDAVFAINHPVLDLGDVCIGCAWSLPVPAGRVGALEIQNGQYSGTGSIFFPRATRFWDDLLDRGERVAPIGGSDDHRAGRDTGSFASPIGGPTTMVYASELSVGAIVAGVRAGRTVVKLQGPGDPMVDLRTTDGAMLGDTLRAPGATLTVTVTGGRGAELAWVRNGEATQLVAVNADPFTATLPVRAPSGGAREDRWRCELSINSRPRVVTGHIWLAPSQGPVDAGIDAGALGGIDAGTSRPSPSEGCSCRGAPAGTRGAPWALAALGFLTRVRRPRRRAGRRAGHSPSVPRHISRTQLL